jgi:UDP-2-acetamido-2,6-beta-L-arabino-hexul-4-ose reductase
LQSSDVIVEVVTVNRDVRGCVFEPLMPEALAAQRNVHVVVTEPGGIRGNHYHRRGTEVLTVLGPALVRTKRDFAITDTRVPEGAVYRFTIPRGTSHAIQNTGTASAILVSFNSETHDPECPDVVRDIILEA